MDKRRPGRQWTRFIPLFVWMAGLIPLVDFGIAVVTDHLGPLETLIRGTGGWALRFLTATLLVTPLIRLVHAPWIAPSRRHLGLLTFTYASIHLSLYLGLDQGLDLVSIVHDVLKRPFITLGMTAFLCLVPLALTSTNGMIRRLGGRRWKALHRLVYAIAVLAVVHYWMLVKKDVTQPAIYGAIVALLLGLRVYWVWRRASVRSPMVGAPVGIR